MFLVFTTLQSRPRRRVSRTYPPGLLSGRGGGVDPCRHSVETRLANCAVSRLLNPAYILGCVLCLHGTLLTAHEKGAIQCLLQVAFCEQSLHLQHLHTTGG